MAIEIKDLQRAAQGSMYVAPERIYVDADGEICADAASGGRLLVPKGGAIPATEAASYGLIAEAIEDAIDELAGLTRGDLLELAAKRGIKVAKGATEPQIREALESASAAE